MRGGPAGANPAPALDVDQRAAAERGLKSLIPFHGHPFLAYVLSAAADGGIRDVCLVVGPGDDPVRARFAEIETARLRITFAVQARPTGTAHALLAAEGFSGGDPVLVLNADNLYPAAVVERVRALPRCGLAGFRARGLEAHGNVPPARIADFAVVVADEAGCLASITEKPGAAALSELGDDPLVSMTCWRFTAEIFEACRRVPASARGEHELPDAALALARGGTCVRVEPVEAGVLDLTERADVAAVEERLRGRRVWL